MNTSKQNSCLTSNVEGDVIKLFDVVTELDLRKIKNGTTHVMWYAKLPLKDAKFPESLKQIEFAKHLEKIDFTDAVWPNNIEEIIFGFSMKDVEINYPPSLKKIVINNYNKNHYNLEYLPVSLEELTIRCSTIEEIEINNPPPLLKKIVAPCGVTIKNYKN